VLFITHLENGQMSCERRAALSHAQRALSADGIPHEAGRELLLCDNYLCFCAIVAGRRPAAASLVPGMTRARARWDAGGLWRKKANYWRNSDRLINYKLKNILTARFKKDRRTRSQILEWNSKSKNYHEIAPSINKFLNGFQ